MTSSTRRGFLRHLSGAVLAEPTSSAERSPPASRFADEHELEVLADRHGLSAYVDAILAVSRISIRIGLDDDRRANRRSRAATPDERVLLRVPGATMAKATPISSGCDAHVVARSDGSVIARVVAAAHQQEVVGLGPNAPRGIKAKLSAERVLPRPWSAALQDLRMTSEEVAAWQELRVSLAALQGVGLEDKGNGQRTIHRVGGFPDERRGDMPLACALLEAGHRLDVPPNAHPLAAAHEARARDWRLVLQLSDDDRLGWSWGRPGQRLYVWAADDTHAIAGAELRTIIQ